MNVADLVKIYPFLYHMAEEDSWENIKKHGLNSTTALLDLFEIDGAERRAIEKCHRPESVEIEHPKHGKAVIRDQKPMSDDALIKCLQDGLKPTDWYQILNKKTFFWARRERLERLLNARAYRNKAHDVLTVNTSKLIEKYESQITLCAYNSGSTIMNPVNRGNDTFRSIEDYPYDYWMGKRSPKVNALVEVVANYSVPDIHKYVTKVERMVNGDVVEVIWKSN